MLHNFNSVASAYLKKYAIVFLQWSKKFIADQRNCRTVFIRRLFIRSSFITFDSILVQLSAVILKFLWSIVLFTGVNYHLRSSTTLPWLCSFISVSSGLLNQEFYCKFQEHSWISNCSSIVRSIRCSFVDQSPVLFIAVLRINALKDNSSFKKGKQMCWNSRVYGEFGCI